MTRWLMAAAVVLVLAGEARAGMFVDGHKLQKWCGNESGSQEVCTAYILGVADVMATAEEMMKTGWRSCFPDNVMGDQLKDVVKRWLEKYPEIRHYEAVSLVVQALQEAFPCE